MNIEQMITEIEERQRKVPVLRLIETGQPAMIEIGVFNNAAETAKHLGRIVPVIAGMQNLFNHLDPISNNLFLFYTHTRVVTTHDLIVVVISEKNQIMKTGYVSALSAESDAFSRFMEDMYHNFSFAFAYPTMISYLKEDMRSLYDHNCGDSWQPLLNGKKIVVEEIPEDELPKDEQGNTGEVLQSDSPVFSPKTKNQFGG